MEINLLNSVLAAALFWFAYRSVRDLAGGNRSCIHYAILTHCAFIGIPAILDVAVGPPLYSMFPRYSLFENDIRTSLVYTLYMLACPFIWRRFFIVRPRTVRGRYAGSQTLLFGLWLAAYLPAIALLFAPNPSLYLKYGAIISETFSTREAAFHSSLAALGFVSVCAAAGTWAVSQRLAIALIGSAPALLIDLWLHGKRAIVLLAVLVCFFSLVERGVAQGRRLAIGGIIAFGFFVLFNYTYQTSVRSVIQNDATVNYRDFRLDFGRDHVIKMALFTELHADTTPILEYRGQGFMFYATAFLPRWLWPEKPWPYAVYSTADALGIPARDLGWALTTSWLEECVANCGWLGLVLAPLSIGWIALRGDRFDTFLMRLLCVSVSCLLLTLQFAAFYLVASVWFVALCRSEMRRLTTPGTRRIRVDRPFATLPTDIVPVP